ncbi:MAG: WbuC family cupin fold metalloprotein [Candidatus Hydrogenedentes bacterium]|nr:WbuC family cupin fold metalloprotein [Candidatus Hydrogenedentota bacterium]
MSGGGTIRVSPAATRSCHDTLAVVDGALIEAKARDAAASARGREIHCFHTGNEDTLQRMLNALQPGSYITPHQHGRPPKAESIVLLAGSLGFVPFAEDGTPDIAGSVLLDGPRGRYAVDFRAGLWHTFFALEPGTVLFEVKPGPYDPDTDKQFAPWAPPEGDARAAAYLAGIEDSFRAYWNLPGRPW